MDIQLERPLVFIDVESTGTNTLSDRIVELSALKIHPDGAENILSTRINPEVLIPQEATAIHGITDKDVENKPTFNYFVPKLKDFLDGCDIAGFNVKKFDLDIIEAEFRRAGLEFSREGISILDIQTIYHKFEPRDLPAAYKKYCDKEMEKHHSSEHDVRATFDILESQLKKHSELPRTVKDLHDFCSERIPPYWIDSKGKFIWLNGEATVNFGPHKGKPVSYMVKNEPGFLEWMVNKDFLPDAKKIASDALKGEFPKDKRI